MSERRQTFARIAIALAAASLGCAGTTRLDTMVLAYDETTADTVAKLLLLNIARANQSLPMHFTQVSSILATYKVTVSGGIVPAATGDLGWLPMPQLGVSREENPTITVSPMLGDEFTQRLLTPFPAEKLTLLLRQGYDVDALLRLLGAQLHLHDGGTAYSGVRRNRPSDKQGYEIYRRIVSHLSSIQDRQSLFVEPLHFIHTWTIAADAVTPEAYASTYKDFTLTYDPQQRTYRVSKRINGRVMISNYDPSKLPEAERRRLHELADEAPASDVLIDIRPEYVGGELPIQGRLRLRSFHEVLTFLGRSLGEEPEHDVKPDPRTPAVAENPVVTLEVTKSRDVPDYSAFSVALNGWTYSVRRQKGYDWDLKTFTMLTQLFEMSVATVANAGPAVTIAK